MLSPKVKRDQDLIDYVSALHREIGDLQSIILCKREAAEILRKEAHPMEPTPNNAQIGQAWADACD
jgi:hypothetical protein